MKPKDIANAMHGERPCGSYRHISQCGNWFSFSFRGHALTASSRDDAEAAREDGADPGR